jgi:hypothetical protein
VAEIRGQVNFHLNYAESSRFQPVANMRARNHKPGEAAMRASPVLDVEQQLLGVWKVESHYMESRTGERKNFFGEKPNGYLIFTPQKRMMALFTAEGRKQPNTDEDRIAAFSSMAAYSGIYRIEGDKWTTKVDVAWTETWIGSDQIRFFKLVSCPRS